MCADNRISVSIVVPVYNMGEKVETCVSSLMKQTYRNIEIVLVDDGSIDDSPLRCDELAKADSRIKVIHTANQGSGPARNCGIKNSTGDYLYFPDADDFIEPNAIQTMVDYILSTNADIILCGYKDVDEKGRVLFEKKYTYAIVSGEEIRNNYAYYKIKAPEFGLRGAPWNKLFKRFIVERYNIEYPPLRRHQDEAFIARYFDHCESAVFIEPVLYTYYTNDQKAEWKKYPVDYIDAVNGLYRERKNNVLLWNPQDFDTKDMVANEYICNFIKALELSFCPKFKFKRKERVAWIKRNISEGEIMSVEPGANLGRYQRTILKLIKGEKYKTLYAALKFKVVVAGKILRKR